MADFSLVSDRPEPEDAHRLSRTRSDARTTLSVYVRRGARSTIHRHLDRLSDFAHAQGLSIEDRIPRLAMLKIGGPMGKLRRLFGAEVANFEQGGHRFRGRSGSLHLPDEIADIVTLVVGFDRRPIARPALDALPALQAGVANAGLWPTAYASLYGAPAAGQLGSGRKIAVLSLAGAYNPADTNAAAAAMGLGPVNVKVRALPGGATGANPNPANSYDCENALDVQIVMAMAPRAEITLYRCGNNAPDWLNALRVIEEDRPDVLSISMCVQERFFEAPGGVANQTMLAFAQHHASMAKQTGIAIFAASGDWGARGYPDLIQARRDVDFPACDPNVCGVGGTTIYAVPGGSREKAWNSNGRVTGGGVSRLVARPAYQQAIVLENANNGLRGRGVPDVSAAADLVPGYRIIVGGQAKRCDGTSAAAPLWAGLVARAASDVGRKPGFLLPRLYATAGATRNVSGSNNDYGQTIGFQAAAGWDACTGLGSPIWAKLLTMI